MWTIVSGPIFVAVMAIILVPTILWYIRHLHLKIPGYSDRIKASSSQIYPIIARTALEMVLLVLFPMLIVSVGWTAYNAIIIGMQPIYENQPLKKEITRIENSQLPDSNEIERNKQELIKKQEIQKHKKSIDSFDEAMKKEHDKIKSRNLDPNQTSPKL